jgi:hypothetical protein
MKSAPFEGVEQLRKLKEATFLESLIGFGAAFVLFCGFFLMDFGHWIRILLTFPVCVTFVVCLSWFVYTANRPESSVSANKTTDRHEPSIQESAIVITPVIEEPAPPVQPAPELTISEKLRRLDGFQFEKLVGLIYHHRGLSLKRLGGAEPDGEVCLINESPNEKIVVQCKPWPKGNVNLRQIRALRETLTDSKLAKGVFITLKGYTRGAKQMADKHGINILSEADIIKMLEESGLLNAREVSEIFSDGMDFFPKGEKEMAARLLL